MDVEYWTTTLTSTIARVAGRILDFLPTVLGAAFILLVGWFFAWLLSYTGRHLVEIGLRNLSKSRPLRTRFLRSIDQQSISRVVGKTIFWMVLLFFLTVALETLGLSAVSNVIGYITAYIPRLLAGLAIVFAGVWIGELARVFSSRLAASSGLGRSDLLGRLAQFVVILLSVIIASEQLGIDNTILITLTITIIAGLLGAAALAFGLGAKRTAANIIAVHYLRRDYAVGESVSIDDVEGTITDISATAVKLDSKQGQVMIPADRFNMAMSTKHRNKQREP